jgi:hypothetical protein
MMTSGALRGARLVSGDAEEKKNARLQRKSRKGRGGVDVVSGFCKDQTVRNWREQ